MSRTIRRIRGAAITAAVALGMVVAPFHAPRVLAATDVGYETSVQGTRRILVHVETFAAVPPETIAAARDELAHIYDAVGVRLDWSAVPDNGLCVRQFTVHVVLLGGAAADRFVMKEQVGRNVLAQANSDARRIYVFWERIGPAIDHQAIARGDALGLVLAHELGHVLMPARKHSRDGIMARDYQVHRSYALQFTAEERAAMRAFLDATE